MSYNALLLDLYFVSHTLDMYGLTFLSNKYEPIINSLNTKCTPILALYRNFQCVVLNTKITLNTIVHVHTCNSVQYTVDMHVTM